VKRQDGESAARRRSVSPWAPSLFLIANCIRSTVSASVLRRLMRTPLISFAFCPGVRDEVCAK